MYTADLFANHPPLGPAAEPQTIAPGAFVLRGFALAQAELLWSTVQDVCALAPLRHMCTPGGLAIQVASTSCGRVGWVADRKGYRYTHQDPLSGQAWPAMPAALAQLARTAAAAAGYAHFLPDTCLINRYAENTQLTLHQDRDEQDLSAPIVSVSLGLPAVFLFGGLQRQQPCKKLRLEHGDVMVWGGPSRLNYHGVRPLKPGYHSLLNEHRYNLTFRKAQ